MNRPTIALATALALSGCKQPEPNAKPVQRPATIKSISSENVNAACANARETVEVHQIQAGNSVATILNRHEGENNYKPVDLRPQGLPVTTTATWSDLTIGQEYWFVSEQDKNYAGTFCIDMGDINGGVWPRERRAKRGR